MVARPHTDAGVERLTKCGDTLTIMGEAEIARAMLSLCGSLKAAVEPPPAETDPAQEPPAEPARNEPTAIARQPTQKTQSPPPADTPTAA